MFYLYIISLLLNARLNEEAQENERTIIVHNFHDYSVYMEKENFHLNIEVPYKTMLFISALNGYKATISYHTEEFIQTISKELIPDPKDRLVYFNAAGYINVTSTINNVNFSFHTLCLNKISEKISQIIISTNPYEKYLQYIPKNARYHSDYSYNSSFLGNKLIWLIGNNYTFCELYQYCFQSLNNPNIAATYTKFIAMYWAFPFVNENNNSYIKFQYVTTSAGYHTELTSYSKLIYISELRNYAYDHSSILEMYCKPKSDTSSYFTNYRAIFNYYSLLETNIISRGQYHFGVACRGDNILSYGIVEYDFSIYNDFEINRINSNLYIFPTISKFRSSFFFNDTIFAIVVKQKVTFHSGTPNFVDESDLNVKVVCFHDALTFHYPNYIISSSPTEQLIIDSYMNENANYTNNINYTYLMVSLQNTETKVIFEGNLIFNKIDIDCYTEIKVKSGDIIKGPFCAFIPDKSVVNFKTNLIGELKEGFDDDGRAFIPKINGTENIFISKKYGMYSNFGVNSTNTSIVFKDVSNYLVETSNLVYVQTKSGWSGEIISPVFEDNKIGPDYDLTSFYISDEGSRSIYIMFRKNDIYDNNFTLHFRTALTQSLMNSKCTRMIVFNDIPSKYGINTKPSDKYYQINVNENENVCMFPAVSYFAFGSENKNINVNLFDITGKKAISHSCTYEYQYCQNVSLYDYYKDNYSIVNINVYSSSNTGILSFRGNTNKLGLLHDEPMIFYDFEINTEYGIHSFGENIYYPVTKGDDISNDNNDDENNKGDDDDEYDDVAIELNKTNKFDKINMSKIRIVIFECPRTTLFMVHFMKGFVVEYYETTLTSPSKNITEESPNKIFKFGVAKGRIIVRKRNTNSKLLDNSENDLFIYSYVIIDKVTYESDFNVCRNILISSNPTANFYIKGNESNLNNYNYTLSNEKSFCLWYALPIYTKIECSGDLPNSQILFLDDTIKRIQYSSEINYGYNFIFVLNNISSDYKNGFHKYLVSPVDNNQLNIIENYEKVNKIFDYDSINGVFGEVEEKNDIIKENNHKRSYKLLYFILFAFGCFMVIIIVIAIIAVCIHKNKKNKVQNFDNDDKSCDDVKSNSNQTQNYNQNQPQNNAMNQPPIYDPNLQPNYNQNQQQFYYPVQYQYYNNYSYNHPSNYQPVQPQKCYDVQEINDDNND